LSFPLYMAVGESTGSFVAHFFEITIQKNIGLIFDNIDVNISRKKSTRYLLYIEKKYRVFRYIEVDSASIAPATNPATPSRPATLPEGRRFPDQPLCSWTASHRCLPGRSQLVGRRSSLPPPPLPAWEKPAVAQHSWPPGHFGKSFWFAMLLGIQHDHMVVFCKSFWFCNAFSHFQG
jgi:hypothetical protein